MTFFMIFFLMISSLSNSFYAKKWIRIRVGVGVRVGVRVRLGLGLGLGWVVLLNTFAKGKCGLRTLQCSLTHLPKIKVAYSPSSAPKHICQGKCGVRTFQCKKIIE